MYISPIREIQPYFSEWFGRPRLGQCSQNARYGVQIQKESFEPNDENLAKVGGYCGANRAKREYDGESKRVFYLERARSVAMLQRHLRHGLNKVLRSSYAVINLPPFYKLVEIEVSFSSSHVVDFHARKILHPTGLKEGPHILDTFVQNARVIRDCDGLLPIQTNRRRET